MTVDQVIEKITINQAWAVEAYKNLPTAPPKERATFGLAASARLLLANSLQDMAPESKTSRSALVYYLLEDPATVEAEVAGEIILLKKCRSI